MIFSFYVYISRCAGIPDLTGELVFDFRSRQELCIFSDIRPHGIRDIHIRDRSVDRDSVQFARAFDCHEDIFLRARVERDPRTAVRPLLSVRIRSGLLHSDSGKRCHCLQISHCIDDRIHNIFLNDRSSRSAIRSARSFVHTGRDHLVHRIKDSCHSNGSVRCHARGCHSVRDLLSTPVLTAHCACDCPHDVPALSAGCQTGKPDKVCSGHRVGHYEHYLIQCGKQPDIAACRDSRSLSEKRLGTSCRVEENDGSRRAEDVRFLKDRIDSDEVTRRFRRKTHIALRSDLDLSCLDDCGAFQPHDVHDCRDRAGQSICVRSRYADHLFAGFRSEGYISFAASDLRVHTCFCKHRRSRIDITVIFALRSLSFLPVFRRYKRVLGIVKCCFNLNSQGALDPDSRSDLSQDIIRVREYNDRTAARRDRIKRIRIARKNSSRSDCVFHDLLQIVSSCREPCVIPDHCLRHIVRSHEDNGCTDLRLDRSG